MDNKELRKHIKSDMKGNWFMAVVMSIVLSIISMIIGRLLMTFMPLDLAMFGNIDFSNPTNLEAIEAVSPISTFVSSFSSGIFVGIFTAIFTLGFSWTFLDLVDQSVSGFVPKLKLELLFSAINKNAFKNILILILRSIFINLAYLVLVVPGIIVSLFLTPLPYLLKDKPDISIREAFSESTNMMKRNVGKLFSLYLPYIISFIVYIIVAIATFFVLAPKGPNDDVLGFIFAIILVSIFTVIITFYLQIKIEIISSEFYRRYLAPKDVLEESNIDFE